MKTFITIFTLLQLTAPTREVVIEQNPVVYVGPGCRVDEVCVMPPNWDTREFLPDGTVRHVFTIVPE